MEQPGLASGPPRLAGRGPRRARLRSQAHHRPHRHIARVPVGRRRRARRASKPSSSAAPRIRRLSAEQFVDALSRGDRRLARKPARRSSTSQRPARAAPVGRTRSALAIADPLTTALGRPNREQVVTVRAAAATTLQALELSNGPTLSQRLSKGAERLLAENAATAGPLVDRVYHPRARPHDRHPTSAASARRSSAPRHGPKASRTCSGPS